MTQWRGKFCVKLNVTNPGAVSWFLDKVGSIQAHLEMEYILLEGGERNLFEEQSLRPPEALGGDTYISLLADVAARIGDSTIMSAGTRCIVRFVSDRFLNQCSAFCNPVCSSGLATNQSFSG